MSEKQTEETSLVKIVILSAIIAAITYLPFAAMGFSWGIFPFLWIVIIIGFLYGTEKVK